MVKDNFSESELVSIFNSPTPPWGILTSVDLQNCDAALIRSKKEIENFTIQLCDLIDMRRFGDPTIVHFGKEERVSGYSLVQLIETSLVSGHFAEESNGAYIDIFSCKYFDPNVVYDFCFKFFKAHSGSVKTILRG